MVASVQKPRCAPNLADLEFFRPEFRGLGDSSPPISRNRKLFGLNFADLEIVRPEFRGIRIWNFFAPNFPDLKIVRPGMLWTIPVGIGTTEIWQIWDRTTIKADSVVG
jgi:hypothetical protein